MVEIRGLQQLEEQNAKLKRLVADLTLDKAMLQDAARALGPGDQRGETRRPRAAWGADLRAAAVGMGRHGASRCRRPAWDHVVRDAIGRMAATLASGGGPPFLDLHTRPNVLVRRRHVLRAPN